MTEAAVARPGSFLLVSLALAGVSVWAASHLEIRGHILDHRQSRNVLLELAGFAIQLVGIRTLHSELVRTL